MCNDWLGYDIVHIIGVGIFIFSLIFSGVLIKIYTRKYENVEIFWIPWLFVIGLVMGNKFI
jgi:hypothetical protein